jgi:hypothetical protein
MISAEKVMDILGDCFYKDEELINGVPTIPPIEVEGIITNVGLHPERVKKHEEEIISLLNELSEKFMKASGGGYTFLNMCEDKYGNQWGEQMHAEALMMLGMAINKVSYSLSRDFWTILPGSVPYITIDL